MANRMSREVTRWKNKYLNSLTSKVLGTGNIFGWYFPKFLKTMSMKWENTYRSVLKLIVF